MKRGTSFLKEVPLSVKRTAIGHAKQRVSGAAWVAKKWALPKGNKAKEVPLSIKRTAIGGSLDIYCG